MEEYQYWNFNVPDNNTLGEHRKLLNWCIHRGCIWEWNRQYALYLLHKIENINIPKTSNEGDCQTVSGVYIPYYDLRGNQYKNGYKKLIDLKNTGKIHHSDLEIQLICWACLSDTEINDGSSLVKSMKAYEERITTAACDVEYFAQFSKSTRGAYLFNLEIQDAKLENILLTRANINFARFSNVKMFQANLEYARCAGIVISDSDLREANLSNSYFAACNITDTCLNQAIANSADFSYARVTRCSISGGEECDAYTISFARIQEIEPDSFKTSFDNVDFSHTKFTNVIFAGADLSKSTFTHSILKNVDFTSADLKGCNFQYSDTDSATLFTWNQEGTVRLHDMIDENTDFTGVALSATRINPNLKTALEKNIRMKYWNNWYEEHKIASPIIKLFWWISDYGTTSVRALYSFLGLNFFAFIIYMHLKWNEISEYPEDMINSIFELFGNTLLTMFGLGNVGLTGVAVLLTAVHVISGYFILAILVTRFAIMFQSQTA